MIDIFMDASSHYGQAVDSSTYFELALLKICNQIENEHKEVVIEEPTIIEDVSHETLQWFYTGKSEMVVETSLKKPVSYGTINLYRPFSGRIGIKISVFWR